MSALGPSRLDRHSHGLWSLWDMLQNYLPIYQITLELQRLRSIAETLKGAESNWSAAKWENNAFAALLETIIRECPNYGFVHTAELAKRALSRPLPATYADMFSVITTLDDSLSYELEKESVFRIPPERKEYFDQDELFGPKVAAAFQSCERDIRRAEAVTP